MPERGDPYFTRAQLAARYGVTTRTVSAWARAGRLPRPLKSGPFRSSRVRWRREEVLRAERELFKVHTPRRQSSGARAES